MNLEPLDLAGAWLVVWEPNLDERGSFARTFCADTFAEHGLDPVVAQCNVSSNRHAGTLRGLHLQERPAAESKLIRCSRGAVYDVLVDLRPDSPTYCRWISMTLGQDDAMAVYAPEGVAHGFLTLAEDTELTYQMSRSHDPDRSTGVRWDDPAFGIEWPDAPRHISERDRSFPDFQP